MLAEVIFKDDEDTSWDIRMGRFRQLTGTGKMDFEDSKCEAGIECISCLDFSSLSNLLNNSIFKEK